MTHDERIENVARAVDRFVDADLSPAEWTRLAEAALAAAGVEEMVRAAAFDGFVQGQSFDGFDNRVGTAATIDDIVREVMGK
jgi:hypothetical protein